jgi:hypothetical protein
MDFPVMLQKQGRSAERASPSTLGDHTGDKVACHASTVERVSLQPKASQCWKLFARQRSFAA